MGILNITPDSFSDGGMFLDFNTALKRAEKMIEEGVISLILVENRRGPDQRLLVQMKN